jgi:hypothetical protein
MGIHFKFENARTNVLVNGAKIEEFFIEMGVWQGCPLAPYHYLLVANIS